jgi:DNA-binding transcriptional LysR family regulator
MLRPKPLEQPLISHTRESFMPETVGAGPGRVETPIACLVTGVGCTHVSLPGPELRQLRYFVGVVEEGSMTRAASRLRIAQQSLSQQIHILETQLGARLLTRTNRDVSPTHVGEVLLHEARAVLAQAARANDAVRRAARGDIGELRLGFLTTVAHDLMPPVVRAFAEQHSGIALHTEDLQIAALVAGVREGRLDAGLSRPPLVDDITAEPVYDEPVAAVLPADTRSAAVHSSRSPISPANPGCSPRAALGHRGTTSTTPTSRRPATAPGSRSGAPHHRPCSPSSRPASA